MKVKHNLFLRGKVAVLFLAAIVIGGCTQAQPEIEETGDFGAQNSATNNAQVAHTPTLPTLSAQTKQVVWEEPYPRVVEQPRAIAKIPPAAVREGLQVIEGAVEINTRQHVLEWRSDALRTADAQRVHIVNAQGNTQYFFSLVAQPSHFLSDVLGGFWSASDGNARVSVDQWWVGDADRSYFYVGGRRIAFGGDGRTTTASHHVQVIFAHPSASGALTNPDNDRALLLAREIAEGELNIKNIQTVLPNQHYVLAPVPRIRVLERILREQQVLCAPPVGQRTYDYDHPFTVTRAHVRDRRGGNAGRMDALNGSQHFLLLSKEQQRNCFAQSYLFEILPSNRPTTTAAHRASLPSGTRYARRMYDLVWNEEFEDGTTIDSLLEEGYEINTLTRHPAFEVPSYRTTSSTLDDPVKVENGKLYLGYGVKPKRVGVECDPEKMDNPGEVLNPERCVIASIAKVFNPPVHFKYGLLEIDFARAIAPSNGMYMWLSSHADWFDWWSRKNSTDLSVGHGYPERYAGARFRDSIVGHRPVFAYADTLSWELRYYGAEYQLMETASVLPQYRGASAFLVNHYGFALDEEVWMRIIETYYFTPGSRYRFAIEWTPEGYIVWMDEGRGMGYEKYRPFKDTLIVSGPDSGGACKKKTNGGKTSTINGVAGIIQCGIVHAPMQLEFVLRRLSKWTSADYKKLVKADETDTTKGFTAVDPRNRFMEIDSIRLYKPRDNYASITPLYQ